MTQVTIKVVAMEGMDGFPEGKAEWCMTEYEMTLG